MSDARGSRTYGRGQGLDARGENEGNPHPRPHRNVGWYPVAKRAPFPTAHKRGKPERVTDAEELIESARHQLLAGEYESVLRKAHRDVDASEVLDSVYHDVSDYPTLKPLLGLIPDRISPLSAAYLTRSVKRDLEEGKDASTIRQELLDSLQSLRDLWGTDDIDDAIAILERINLKARRKCRLKVRVRAIVLEALESDPTITYEDLRDLAHERHPGLSVQKGFERLLEFFYENENRVRATKPVPQPYRPHYIPLDTRSRNELVALAERTHMLRTAHAQEILELLDAGSDTWDELLLDLVKKYGRVHVMPPWMLELAFTLERKKALIDSHKVSPGCNPCSGAT